MISNISVNDIVVDETSSVATFKIWLDFANTTPITVNYGTYSGTANGYDFTGKSGVLTFAPGETIKTVSVSITNDTTVEAVENFKLYLSNPSSNATIADNLALATLIDNDAGAGTPVVSINDFVVDEGGNEATFVITLNKPSNSLVSMNYATQNGTAIAGSDFVAASGTLKFAPGETAKTIKVTLLNDSLAESSEVFNLSLSAITNATTLDPIGTAIIAENDATRVAVSNLSVDDIFVDETQTYADFTVHLDKPNTGTVTVNYSTYDGTANGYDFDDISGYLTFASGEMVKTVRVDITNDTTVEAVENFKLYLSNSSSNATIADDFALATIIDNDAGAGTPVVSINDFVVDEAGKEATFVITLNKPSNSLVSMNYATQNGTAIAGSDFVAASGTLKFAPGETAKTIKVTLLNDSLAESSEVFNLSLSAITNATTLDPIGTAIIAENDATRVAVSNLSVDDIFVDETQTYADFTVHLDKPNTGTVTVNYSTYDGTANGYDFDDISGYLTFASGEMVKTVRVDITNDTTVEAVENFKLYLSNSSSNATIADDFALATIIDNDAGAGTPVVSINDFVVDEAGKEATFVITLNKPSNSLVSMNYATQNGTAIAGSDFVAASGTLKFAPGETAKTIKVTLLNDSLAESSEVFNLSLSAITNATTLDPIGTAIIAENDATRVAVSNLSVDDIFVDETQTYADFTVHLDKPNTGTVTVNYSTYDGTANGYDFDDISGYLTFASGEMVKTVRVDITNDTTVEAVENFKLYLSNSSSNATIADDFALATIIDNDAGAGTPVVSINDFVVDEAGKEATFVITLNKPSNSLVSMNYATQNGTAIAGSDFVAASGTLKFAPGETAKTIKVTLLNDSLAESSEVFNLSLSAITNATTLDPIGTAIIAENDATRVAVSNLSVDDIFVDETQTYADFTVHLDKPNTGTVTVNYSTYDGTANGYDFDDISGYLTFASGEMVKTVRVDITNDTTVEAVENFKLYLSNPSSNATIADNLALATIIDNDAGAGTPVVSINDFVVDEGGKEATFVITLNKPSNSLVSMNYATQNGTAIAGSDFVAASGTLKFAPGETAKTIKVTLLNDSLAESSEVFNLSLSAITNATTLDPIGTAIIAENDATRVAVSNLSVDDIFVDETQTYADFTVHLDKPNTGTVTVNYSTYDGTANGYDFDDISGYLTFASGEMVKTVRVDITNDTTVEAVENFKLYLSNSSSNATIADDFALATIIDNDAGAGTPVVSINDFVVDEAGKEATFVITLNKPSNSLVSMNYATQNGTAIAGSDFVAASGTLKFAPGETAKTIKVTLLNDSLAESSEVFNLSLSAITNATTLDPIGTAIIAENDATRVAVSNLSVDDIFVDETQTYADFTVHLDKPNTGTVTVNYSTYDGTANGYDFDDISGYLTFASGEMVKTVRVDITNDTTVEAVENFKLYLSNSSSNATIADDFALATIIDNDGPEPSAPVNIVGTAGNDILNGTLYVDSLTGGNGNDILNGAGGNDTLYGNAGNDILNGGAGADKMFGGSGNDLYYVDNTGDRVYETTTSTSTIDTGGVDTVYSSLAAYTLGSYVEDGHIMSNGVANLTGNSLNNTIYAGAGNNIITGDAGTDTVSYANAGSAVKISLALTTAQATGGSATDTLTSIELLIGSNHNDNLTGNNTNNNLSGLNGNDILSGLGGNDILYGGAGNDTIDGGLGNDTLIGGTGADYFDFTTALNATGNKDSITDFSLADDTIRLENSIMTGLGIANGVLAAGAFHSGTFNIATEADDRIIYNSSTGALFYDADGTGSTAVVQIAVIGISSHPALTNADFMVI